MKVWLTFGLVLAFLTGASGQTFYGSTDLKTFRAGRDKEFRDAKESPLDEQSRKKFRGLLNYPVAKRFRVKATFTRTPNEKYFDIATSTGEMRKFVKYGGILSFSIDGKQLKLSAYQVEEEVNAKYPEYADLLFVPFRDSTNRSETYGGGRYIDIKIPKSDSAILDFNLAYNPSCAYGNDRFSCPLPPSENKLEFAVKAGEKRYK